MYCVHCQVNLCEAVRLAELLDDDVMLNRTTGSRSKLVAVKILHIHADEQARSVFSCDLSFVVASVSDFLSPIVIVDLGKFKHITYNNLFFLTLL